MGKTLQRKCYYVNEVQHFNNLAGIYRNCDDGNEVSNQQIPPPPKSCNGVNTDFTTFIMFIHKNKIYF
jgi:hypothetical protein